MRRKQQSHADQPAANFFDNGRGECRKRDQGRAERVNLVYQMRGIARDEGDARVLVENLALFVFLEQRRKPGCEVLLSLGTHGVIHTQSTKSCRIVEGMTVCKATQDTSHVCGFAVVRWVHGVERGPLWRS